MSLEIDRVWELLEDAGIPVLSPMTASSPQNAVEAARVLGYPVVMKISSPDISHKSDVGGVVLNLANDRETETAYETMMESLSRKVPEAKLEGVILQKMAAPGVEVIVGAKLDPQFGHVIMFGLGGIFVEIFRDVIFRITPVDEDTARDMILGIKASPILTGARGRQPVDIEAVIDVITKLSKLLEQQPGIVELEINPLVVYPRGAVTVDTRMLAE